MTNSKIVDDKRRCFMIAKMLNVVGDNKDDLNDNNVNSCILAGLTNPPFALILSLLGKAASSIVFLTGFQYSIFVLSSL